MSDAALDATAEALTRRILARLPPDRPRSAADIDQMPAPLAMLLHARLGAAVDAAAPTPSAWLDGEAVRQATDAWRAAALADAHVPADVWPEAVGEAARVALAHLVRPASTLAATAFAGGRASMPVADALERARAFGPYPYLPQIAARYAARKDLDTIDQIGLEQLFQRIDRRMVSTFGPADWSTLLGPLVDLVGPVGSPAGAVPTALLRMLFEARGADTLAAELDGIDAVSPDELRALLDRILVPAEAPPPAALAPPPALSEAPSDPAEPPALPPLPTPPVARGVQIGSTYKAPEFDDVDESEVLGPPVPAGTLPASDDGEAPPPLSSPDDAMALVRDALTEPVGEETEAEAPEVAPDEARGSNPLITPAPAAAPEAFIFPDEEPADKEPPPTLPPAAPAPPAPALPASAPVATEPDPEPPADAPVRIPAFDDEPLWKQLVRERGDDEVPAPAPEADAADEPDDEPLWKRFANSDLASRLPTPPAVPLPDLDEPTSPHLDALEARVLGAAARERRDWYVTELFDGSPSAYHRTLDRIDRSASYTEATGIISSDIFRANAVNPYTESAVAFIDAVQDHFERRGPGA